MPLLETAKQEGHQFSKFINKLSGQPESYSRKSQYTFGKTLGAGSFGVVRYARDVNTQQEVAVKIILRKALKGNEQMVYDELKLLQQLKHPHIVGFVDWFESKDKFYIVTQLATGGELFDRIVNWGKFTEHDASKVISQMLDALDYIHDLNIVHRDIKPENVLYLTPDDDSNIVLADFGIAKKLHSQDEVLTSTAGSFGYAAPEVILGTGHGKPCDVWSLGVITYTLLCGYSPFRSENVQDFIAEVRHNNAVIFHAQYWKDVSKDARRFIVKALQVKPENRPTVKQLINDPWLVSIAKENNELDLLPNIRRGFDAKSKFKQAIEIVRLNNRIKKLKDLQNDDDDDPDDIDFFNVSNSSSSISPSDSQDQKPASGFNYRSPFTSLSALASSLTGLKVTDNSTTSSVSDAAAITKDSEDNEKKLKLNSKKSELTTGAFLQLVEAAQNNKERVASYNEENK